MQTRRAAADRLAALVQEANSTIPRLRDTVSSIEAELKTHEQKGQAIKDRLSQARVELSGASVGFDQDRGAAEQILIDTAPEEIDNALDWFRDQIDALRRKKADHDSVRTGKNLAALEADLTHRTNAPSIRAALEYCRGAVRTIEGMKLDPAFNGERVEKLKACLPDPDETVEFSGSRPLPRPIDLMDLIPCDSTLDYIWDKIIEKADRLLAKPARR